MTARPPPVPPGGADPAGPVATAEFLLRLRTRGIQDLDVLRAIERVPRHIFVPHRYADLATRDVALPIGCGQTMPEPFAMARMIEALDVKPGHRVLEIGTGSGLATAVLAKLATAVLSLERFQSLAIEARTRLQGLQIDNAEVVWADGLALPPEAGVFDRILVEAVVDAVPAAWRTALTPGGALLMARRGTPRPSNPRPSDPRPSDQCVVRATPVSHDTWDERRIMPSRLQPLLPGVARGL